MLPNNKHKTFDCTYFYGAEGVKNTSIVQKHEQIIKAFQSKHRFHLVEASQLPIITSFTLFVLTTSIILHWHPMPLPFFSSIDAFMLVASALALIIIVLSWFVKIVQESAAGHHTEPVRDGLRLGVILFIVSEIMFFFAFFWAYFHYSIAPSFTIGCTWPPAGVQTVPPLGLPLVNTLLLLTSGLTLTISHRALITALPDNTPKWAWKVWTGNYLFITCILGLAFLYCQAIEYTWGAQFLIKENVYGTIFFTITGFHGMHVALGTVALAFCAVRIIISGYISPYSPAVLIWKDIFWALFVCIFFVSEFFSRLALFCVIFPTRILVTMAARVHNKGVKKVDDFVFAKKAISRLGPLKKILILAIFQKKLFESLWLFILPLASDLPKFIIEMNKTFEIYGFSQTQHLGFEAAAWYWHFVDVVWILLYIALYCWGS